MAKAIGILFVVAGHIPGIGFFPFLPYTFHIPLFYFLAGVVFDPNYLSRPALFAVRRVRSLLLPYFIYNFIFATMSELAKRWPGVAFEAQQGGVIRLLLLEPFISGHQYMLFAPGWFLCSLLLVGLAYLFILRLLNSAALPRLFYFSLFFTLAVAGMLYGKLESKSRYFNYYFNMVVAKNLVGVFFFYLGGQFRTPEYVARLCDSRILLVACAIQIYCVTHYNANFFVAMNNYPSIVSSFLTSMCGIAFVIFFASLIADSKRLNDEWLLLIGRNSLHILACHLFVFQLLNIIFLSLHGDSLEILSRQFYYIYDAQHLWPVYFSAGIGVPVAVATWINRTRVAARSRWRQE